MADQAVATYFTWPDGRFRYRCEGCGACCKGHGIGIDVEGGQLVQLLGRRPELAVFLRRRGDAITAFNPRDRCWFLADDGLCRVEVEDGREAKPASCRLFPFNRVFAVGDTTVVDYNSVICPLEVVVDGGARHVDVAGEIAGVKDPAVVGTTLPSTDRELIAVEQVVTTALFAAADRGDLDAAWAAQADASALGGERDTVTAAFDMIAKTTWRVPSATTLAAAMWLTPSLRFNELYGPRQYGPRSAMQPILARMWLAWLGFAALGEHLAQRSLGLQELTTMWSEQAPLMHACARWHEPPSLKPGPIDLPGIDPGQLVRKLAQAIVDNRKARRPFGELVATAFTDADVASRVAALKAAESIVRAGFAR